MKKIILNQMLTLSTAAFGLVAALAWNEFIQEVISTYIKPYVGTNSKITSMGIYAVVITALAVFITYTLTKLIKKD